MAAQNARKAVSAKALGRNLPPDSRLRMKRGSTRAARHTRGISMPFQVNQPSPVTHLARAFTVLIACLTSSASIAQPSACERYQAELVSLNRTGASARQAEAATQRHRDEIERLSAYYRSIGCNQGFLFFRPSAECGPIAERMRALQASYQSIASQAYADPAATETRRRQLRAAIEKACDGSTEPELVQTSRPKGGERLVCVRTCDGAYFPLDSQPKENQSNAALCRALCPQADTKVFRASVDGGIEEAVSESGEPYMKLPHALRYRQSFDPSCSCKKKDESWSQALQKAETLIARKKTDVVVTETLSDKMANAKIVKARIKADPDETKIPPTHAMPDVATTGSLAGTGAEVTAQPRKPRIIAPDIIPVPSPNGL